MDSQEKFDRLYITGPEIQARLGVRRQTLFYARRRGDVLPPAISVCGGAMFIWEREAAEPHLRAWERAIAARRGDVHGEEK